MKVYRMNQAVSIINLEGSLTSEYGEELNQAYAKTKDRATSTVVLNFNNLEHMNSAGISKLIKLSVVAKKDKQKLFAVGLSSRYMEVFSLTGLKEGIILIQEMAGELDYLDKDTISKLQGMISGDIWQDDYGWAPYVVTLSSKHIDKDAINKNVDGRRVIGPLKGFGPIWEKNYILTIKQCQYQPADLVSIMKKNLPSFQPAQNKFYTSPQGIAPGEVVLIDSKTPGGIVSTGVMVLYADDTSFTLITPQGHPEAGWVTFSARNDDGAVIFHIQGLASTSDPFYEIAFKIAGSKFQETIWTHVLSSLAAYLEVEPDIEVTKSVVDQDFHWTNIRNMWYNAQIRSIPYNLKHLLG